MLTAPADGLSVTALPQSALWVTSVEETTPGPLIDSVTGFGLENTPPQFGCATASIDGDWLNV